MRPKKPTTKSPCTEYEDNELRQVEPVLPLVNDVALPGSDVSGDKVDSAVDDSPRAVYMLAQLEEEQIKQELELEAQQRLLKARNKVRLAKLKMELAVTDYVPFHSVSNDDQLKDDYVDNYLNECKVSNNICPTFMGKSIGYNSSRVDLPRVELQYFDGSPCNYWKFVRQFEHYVEERVPDAGQRLLYLMHYCKGYAKEAIENCCMLPPNVAYKRARQILEDLFGQTHVIAKSMVDNLLNGLRPLTMEGKCLTQLAIKMQGCEIALSQMNCESDLDALHTLERISRLLPVTLQMNWARVVDKLGKEARHPRFRDLRLFVDEEARVARSRFGQLAFENEHKLMRGSGINKTETKRSNEVRSSFAIQGPTSSLIKLCYVCNGSHRVDRCTQFLSYTVQNRWNCLRKHRACFVCLNLGHRAADCHSTNRCNADGCSNRHHTLMHSVSEYNSSIVKSANCTTINTHHSTVRLGILPVSIKGPKGVVNVYALLDNGSDVTIVERDVLQQIGLCPTPTPLTIATVNGSSTIESGIANLTVISIDDELQVVTADRAFCVERLSVQPQSGSMQETAQRWEHMKDIRFKELPDKRIRLLIGADVPEAHWALEQRFGDRKQPFAVKTILGWIVIGPADGCNSMPRSVNAIQSSSDPMLTQLKLMYNAEFEELNPDTKTPSLEDMKAMKLVESSISLVQGHYEIALPWRDKSMMKYNNYEQAIKRLEGLRRRFRRDTHYFKQYSSAMEHMLLKGYAEPVPQRYKLPEFIPRWYLPHHAVLNAKKPGKFRVVFDCAARYKGTSLNDMLLQGPDITTGLLKVLLNFRHERVAISADVEEMFMQVGVSACDRGALRFLWWETSDWSRSPTEYQMKVHPFGATSSPFCANFALRQTVKDFGENYTLNVSNAVKSNFYVDDLLISVPSVNDAEDFIQHIRTLLLSGGFRLRKWISNFPEALRMVPQSELANPVVKIGDESVVTERALGLEWDSTTDEFRFIFKHEEKETTRRSLLSAVSSLYDPLGLVSPITLPAKLLLQKLCRDGLNWDDPILPNDAAVWKDWLNNMSQLKAVRIPRCIMSTAEHYDEPQLHVFCDASEVGYGVVAYSRYRPKLGTPYCSLIYAKSRVAPLKTMSIPRLELSACQLGVRIANTLRESAVQFQSVTYWTDSTIVLYYIRNTTTRFNTFVANRLATIHQFTVPEHWRHIKSEENPADLASRGATKHTELEKWLKGPTFLAMDEFTWSNEPEGVEVPSDIEFKRSSANVNHLSTETPNLILRHFSDWMKLLRAVAWLSRFKSYLILMKRGRPYSSMQVRYLKVNEIERAKHDVVRMVQLEAFPALIRYFDQIEKGQTLTKSAKFNSLSKLCPLMVNNLLCVGGRLTYTAHPSSVKHPPILPKIHPVTEAIVRYYHILEGHSGVSQVLAAIRQHYWLVQGGAAVKRVIGACITCRKQSALRCKQIMAPVPVARAEPGWYAFRHVGVDYFGPFFVKRGRSHEKRYGCVFSCIQTRAVHLEVAHSLSTDSFISALLRFIGRRGCPSDIYSDNGTNFVGAQRELKDSMLQWDEHKVNGMLLSRGVQWHFQPPAASHRGGIWERIIRSIRKLLNTICSEQTMTDEVLVTVMVEVERILNDRPIVSVTSDDRDEKALTPNHLILLRSNSGLNVDDRVEVHFKKGYRQSMYLASVFWRRWVREYLPTLQARQKWLTPSRNLQEGDLVLVVSDSLSRGRWPLGVISTANISGDGRVRTVSIRTSDGIVTRDVRKVCLLEGNFE